MLIFGWLGGIINCVHVLPQMVKIYRNKSVENISEFSIFIKLIAAILYIVHGFLIWDMPLFVMTLVVSFQYIFILCQYKYYKSNLKCAADTAVSTTSTTPQKNTNNEDPA